jgi:hypothetical protein
VVSDLGISLLCPTRGRPAIVREMLESAVDTAFGPFQAVFFIDDDDTESAAEIARWRMNGFRGVGMPRYEIPMSDMWNWCADEALKTRPHWPLMFIDDEALFHTPGWDMMVIQALVAYRDGGVLVHPNDTIHGEILAAYFAVPPTWVDIFGRLTPKQFTYGYADVWCSEVAQAAGRKVYLPHVVVENRAPKLQPPDRVHEENQERAVRDRPGDLYNATQPERERDVRKLLDWILQPPVGHWRDRWQPPTDRSLG